ncbi:BTAD domain-containing putative transcriptional regulator [Streptomyces leeuwenhoekii]|uniref:HTH-type transcriptional regulator Rv0890c/MT0914 n=2 Tax=Streptomyces leeuwenhoekii TaxID=1437453 RepID=A0A0F7VX57_STRLW|nr:BTAD domain-containing putative transcriptional regulator [Streptomyces leeuwenhoekii]CQR64370.1 Putative HTH-type transcriptional regulator Rv0890c/MT0914 [Streptomyces leeuwenhoekii]
MDPVRYRILGTTQAVGPDGTTVPVGGARLRALLTVLALRPGRTVPAARLVEEVWDGAPPADAVGALQALVGRLRRTLGADAVASADGGYRLAASADDVDLHRFERLSGEGLRALADGDPAKAAEVLDDALVLWQDPVLADLPDRAAEAARWETRRLDALRARHTAALALGHAEGALPELTALCDAHPLDEPLQALRLRALRDTGRTAEALAAYEDVRRLLADRLGADPGPALRALHGELLRRPGAPAPLTPPPAPARAGRPRGNLRARLTSFVGRDADIEVIRDDLATARLVTLLGPGGAGKTRLSQEAAEAAGEAARDGVWLAELAPLDDPDAVPEAVLTAVGARETVLYGAGAEEIRAVTDRTGNPVDRLVEHCGRRRMLIVLDNCEHVVEAAARLTEELLARCPHLTVLATSREPLGVPGELLRPVEPLPEPAALRLLADRGAAARPGFRVEDDPGACAEICRRLDGLPLAIELAAARLRMMTPRQIADRLDDRFRLLTSGSRTLLPRQQTLRAVVDWSWELLDEDERDVLGRLSVFAGGCGLAAAEAVCGPAALEALASLVDKSLVVAAPAGDGEMRYRLLETVAEYAGERLDEAGGRREAERAHLTYYRELARTSDMLLRGPGQLAAIERLEREYENIRTALRRAVAARDEQEALCLALSLIWYWQMRDLRIEAGTWCGEVAALGPDPFTDPVRPARPVWERCTAAPPPMTGEVLAEARRGVHLAHLACLDKNPGVLRSPAVLEKLRTIAATYEPGLPQTCRSPGLLWFFAVMLTGDLERLRLILDAAVRTCRTTAGYEWELAGSLQMRATVLANRADWAGDAARDADESLEIFRRLGDAWGTAEALSARAEALERRGEHLRAAADYAAAARYAERLGAHAQVAVLGARRGSALVDSGDPDEAERGERILRGVIEEAARTGDHGALPAARLFLAGRLSMTGRTGEAREQVRRLREESDTARFAIFDAFVLASEAWLDTLEGRHEESLSAIRRALEQADDPLSTAVAPQMRSVYLTTAAMALAGVDGGRRAGDAARCLGAAAAMTPPAHVTTALERYSRERAVARVRQALGDEAYEAAYAEGGGLSPEEAAALV